MPAEYREYIEQMNVQESHSFSGTFVKIITAARSLTNNLILLVCGYHFLVQQASELYIRSVKKNRLLSLNG